MKDPTSPISQKVKKSLDRYTDAMLVSKATNTTSMYEFIAYAYPWTPCNAILRQYAHIYDIKIVAYWGANGWLKKRHLFDIVGKPDNVRDFISYLQTETGIKSISYFTRMVEK